MGLERTDSDFDLDALINASVAQAQLANGASASVIAARSDAGARLAVVAGASEIKSMRWTRAEDEFLRTYNGYLSEAEMASALGRTVQGVHLRIRRELRLPPPTRHPDWFTAQGASRALGLEDVPKVLRLIECGLLPARRLLLDRTRYAIDRKTFYAFCVQPRHWVYFDPARVNDLYLKRLLAHAVARWNDAWWTETQVAAFHQLPNTELVASHRQKGWIPKDAIARWGNHYYLKSYIVTHQFSTAAAQQTDLRAWSDGGDAFLVLARAVGVSTNAVSLLLTNHYGKTRAQVRTLRETRPMHTGIVSYRMGLLRSLGDIDALCARHHLRVVRRGDRLFADWKLYRDRFPFLARACDRFRASLTDRAVTLTKPQRDAVRTLMAHWSTIFLQSKQGCVSARGSVSLQSLHAAYASLCARGVDIFQGGYMDIRIEQLAAPRKSHSTKTTKAYTCNKCGQGGFHDKRQLFLHRKAAHTTLPTGEAQA